MIRWRLLVFIVCLMVLPGSGRAQDSLKTCSTKTADTSTIAAVVKDYRSWEGRCVRLTGIAIANRLFVDRDATLGPIDDDSVTNSIVIFPKQRRHDREQRRVEIVGKIGSCATAHEIVANMQAQNAGDFIMVGGYCHTSLATYVDPTSIREVYGPPVRRFTEAELPLDRRPLVEVPPRVSGVETMVDAARDMIEAIGKRDETLFRRVSAPETQDEIDKLQGKPIPDWLRQDMRESHSEFLRFTRPGSLFAGLYPLSAHPERVLVTREYLEAAGNEGEPLGEIIVCWCKTSDCKGRWPVTAYDADNGPSRPYLCLYAGGYFINGSSRSVKIDLTDRPAGLAEPPWPTGARAGPG